MITISSQRRWLAAIGLLCAAAFLAACGGNGATTDPTDPGDDNGAAAAVQIPVEALPNPLPEPYLFRDTVVTEAETITETVYIVQPGDTLASIADSFCITTAEIQRLNTIVDISLISIGDELRIPIREGGCGAAAPPSSVEQAQAEPAAPSRPPGDEYIVQPGDTLAAIAEVHGLNWRDLQSYNNLSELEANTLSVGQTLIIPPPPSPNAAPQDQQAQQDGSEEPPG